MSKIVLKPNSIVYVMCPSYYKTGGTELLHQYVYVARKNGIDCRIVYPDANNDKVINPSFEVYVDEYYSLDDIIDDDRNVLILPEIYTEYIKKYNHIKRIIWWESVDNYLVYVSIKYNLSHLKDGFLSYLRQIANVVLHKRNYSSIKEIKKKVDYHFVQSFYAKDFLYKNGIKTNVFYVSDYINDVYTSSKEPFDLKQKEDIVCYNPAKGKKFTKKIIKKSSGIIFVPLVNMTNEEVMNTLKRAKVYIDFGNHPGKDRFPREAASMQCCIITSKDGAANYFEDVKIDSNYKFDKKAKNITKIIECINCCLSNYEKEILKFSDYRKMIFNEKQLFEKNLINCYSIVKS